MTHKPPGIHFQGPQYEDAQRRFQGIPAIERAVTGRLWAAWYGGGAGEDRYNYVLLATAPGVDGEWSVPLLVVDPDGDGPVRAFDPCLWHDPGGRLWLFWAQGVEGQTGDSSGVWAITASDSATGCRAWAEPVRICDGIMMNKPTVLSSGEWLLPVARWRREGSAGVYASTDHGTTWSRRGCANVPDEKDRNCDEHMIVEKVDGRLWMLVRTGYGIGESHSSDRGETWSPVGPSVIPHPAARFFIRRLRSGNLVLVKHGPMEARTGRSHLTAYLSRDDGRSWFGGLLLDERDGVSYPDGVQAPDGTIHIIYDYDRKGAKEILMAVFTEEDVTRCAFDSAAAAQRILVNKAAGMPIG